MDYFSESGRPESYPNLHLPSLRILNMTSRQIEMVAPLASPLPPPPEGDVLTPSQWLTLMAIADTVIPSLEASSSSASATPSNKLIIPSSEYSAAMDELKSYVSANADDGLLTNYLSENASSIPGLKDLLRRTLSDSLRPDARKGVCVILAALE